VKIPEISYSTYCINKTIGLISRKEAGFSFLELILVIAIIGLLFSVAVDKLVVLKAEAERTAMSQILGSLRSAMGIQIASHISNGTIEKLVESINSNPMDWLSEKPENYIGVLNEPDPNDVESRQWYFDSYNKYLVYRVSNSEYFKSTLKGAKRARFRVNLDYTDNNENGKYSPGIDEIHGLTLLSIEPYEWLAEPVDIKDYVSPGDPAVSSAE